MMMGDLVVIETEVNPVMRSLLANGVQVTAVHNHLLRASPATFYMHVGAHGDPAKLAAVVREALAKTKTPFEPPAAPAGEPPKLGFDAAEVDNVLGFPGRNNGGVLQFSIPKAEQIRAGGIRSLPPWEPPSPSISNLLATATPPSAGISLRRRKRWSRC